jgi:hypothetical protein
MQTPKLLFVFAMLLVSSTGFTQSNPSEILKISDSTIFPTNAMFDWELNIKRNGEEDQNSEFLCWKKGDLRYFFFTVAPESNYGQSMLRIDSTIWSYLPLADDTIKTSYKSAFLGSDLSYADIMYNELSLYYDAKLLDEDSKIMINGQTEDAYKLELSAKPGADGYAKIITYIHKKNYATLKRDYYSKSGQLLKEISFSNLVFSGKQIKEMLLTVNQATNRGQTTFAKFYNIKEMKDIAEKYFSLNSIKTFQPSAVK